MKVGPDQPILASRPPAFWPSTGASGAVRPRVEPAGVARIVAHRDRAAGVERDHVAGAHIDAGVGPAVLRVDRDAAAARCRARRRRAAGDVELLPRDDAVAIAIARAEAGVRPVPLGARQRAVAVEVEILELIPSVEALLAADHFKTAQDAVAVGVHAVELGGAAMPFGALDAAVVVPVHVVELGVAHIVNALAEKLLQADRVVAIGVDSTERLEIEVPLVGREAAVAIVIETGEVGARPVQIALELVWIVIGKIGVALGAGAHLVTR